MKLLVVLIVLAVLIGVAQWGLGIPVIQKAKDVLAVVKDGVAKVIAWLKGHQEL